STSLDQSSYGAGEAIDGMDEEGSVGIRITFGAKVSFVGEDRVN
ncbi:hypothetical protein Tco_1558774, partial [Tanacetum coccineum]